MGFGVILLIVKCLFFRKAMYYDYDDEDEMMTEKDASGAIEKKTAKSTSESKNGDSAKAGHKHPHLSITITPASDGSQSGGPTKASVTPSKCAQKEIESCTTEEIEALTSSGNNARHSKSCLSSEKENGDSSDNRNNIKMHEIKASATAKNSSSTVIATSVESSISTATKHDIVQSSKNPSVV